MSRINWSVLFLTGICLIGCSSSHSYLSPGSVGQNTQRETTNPNTARVAHVQVGVTLNGKDLSGLTAEEVSSIINQMARASEIPAVDAHKIPEQKELVHDREGFKINVVETVRRVLEAKPNEKVEAVVMPMKPLIRYDDVVANPPNHSRLLATSSTPILDIKPGRVRNIEITAEYVNNTVVKPGQDWSFNKFIGQPTKDKGFKEGIVYGDGGILTQELGGGMCQVSSTLYSSLLDAGLQVTERHAHSKPVAYIAPGRDATIYTDKDLRFVNNRSKPVVIKAWVAQRKMHVTLYEME
ncbi:hypothetical protein DNHGIG_28440 [Collibacillus ludicampi]|uniref:VanW family protein n=1 Tax=Collibacillus ludicampi TaxID=2771369 RepID=A0AAV4LHP1_9BACL|nr:VanW family protein [Collibacillus ludicampi]GIM47295.1 hypothetical protein DNHGIG_28440 [Collibacillus ludicampi]